MTVLVDTSVWSLALRRAQPQTGGAVDALRELIRRGDAAIIGAIRQEILSGVRTTQQFTRLRRHLRAFPDILVDTLDHEEAAAAFNRCRAHGIQGSNTDFLICAVASRHKIPIFTTDGDFAAFARVLPIRLYEAPA